MSITDRLEEAIIAARIAARMACGPQYVTISEEDAVAILAALKQQNREDMVCTTCRKPVERTSGGFWFHSDLDDSERCSRTAPVKAMVAAGNENTPSSSEEGQ